MAKLRTPRRSKPQQLKRNEAARIIKAHKAVGHLNIPKKQSYRGEKKDVIEGRRDLRWASKSDAGLKGKNLKKFRGTKKLHIPGGKPGV